MAGNQRLRKHTERSTSRRTHIAELDPKRTALLVIDVQRGFVAPGRPMSIAGADRVIENINMLSAALRTAGGKVIFLRHTQTGEGPRALNACFDRWTPRRPDGEYILRPEKDAHELDSRPMRRYMVSAYEPTANGASVFTK